MKALPRSCKDLGSRLVLANIIWGKYGIRYDSRPRYGPVALESFNHLERARKVLLETRALLAEYRKLTGTRSVLKRDTRKSISRIKKEMRNPKR